MVNVTAEEALTNSDNLIVQESSAAAQTSSNRQHDISTLTDRLDSLEAAVRQVSLKQSDSIVSQTEGMVVNKTVSQGWEDIISRVINDKVSAVSLHSAELEARLIRLEDNFHSLSQQMFSVIQAVKESSNTGTTAVTTIPNTVDVDTTEAPEESTTKPPEKSTAMARITITEESNSTTVTDSDNTNSELVNGETNSPLVTVSQSTMSLSDLFDATKP